MYLCVHSLQIGQDFALVFALVYTFLNFHKQLHIAHIQMSVVSFDMVAAALPQ